MNLLRNLIYKVLEQANAEGAAGGATGGGGDNTGSGGGGDGAGNTQRVEVEQRARDWGWTPKEQWRGDPAGWLDAPDFVRRGEQVLPILQANYRKTEAELRQVRQQNQRMEQQLTAATESIEVLTNMSTEQTRQAAKERRRELLRAQAKARTDGDAEAEIDLGEQIADLTVEIQQAEAEPQNAGQPQRKQKGVKPGSTAGGNPPTPPASETDPTRDPDYQAFVQQNSWFGTDRRRTALATAIGQELRADPANNHLQGKAFFDKVVAEVNRTIAPPRQGSKVESGGGGGNGGGGNSDIDPVSGKGFNDLPPEAKSAYERQGKMVVGPGRAFKTMEEWRKYYVHSYYNS
jgi:hypothetical protein